MQIKDRREYILKQLDEKSSVTVAQRLFFDKGFITGNHFTAEHGFSTPIFQEAELKRRVLSVSKEKFILMDYSKYGDDSMVLVAAPNQVDTLITDWRAAPEVVKAFSEKGVKVVLGQPR